MKFIKWKSLIITCIVCLLPILLGLALWNELPDMIAIHFDMYNNPDNFASKAFAVFGLPALMVLLQIICCIVNDINENRFGERKKITTITKWILPVMSIVIHTTTLCYALGWAIDIRKVAMLVVSAIFVVIGNYLPKFDRIKNYKIDTEKARIINRFMGKCMVIIGLLGIVTIFLPPVASVIWLILLIPYAIISIIYGIKVCKR